MNGKLKIAGTALLAALALSAVAASAATDHITATSPWTPTVSAMIRLNSMPQQAKRPFAIDAKKRR